MTRELTCVVCPAGCRITVTLNEDGSVASMEGYTCARGKTYAANEVTHPVRTLTSTVPVMTAEGRNSEGEPLRRDEAGAGLHGEGAGAHRRRADRGFHRTRHESRGLQGLCVTPLFPGPRTLRDFEKSLIENACGSVRGADRPLRRSGTENK